MLPRSQTLQDAVTPNLWQLVVGQAQMDPDKPAVVFDGTSSHTYSELVLLVGQASLLLQALLPGKRRVAICMPNCLDWIIWGFAVKAAGHTLVSINDRYDDESTVELLDRSRTAACITGSVRSFGSHWILEEEALSVTSRLYLNRKVASSAETENSTEATIVFTSGTSAQPKGIVLSHANEVNGGLLLNYETGLNRQDRVLITTPFSHRPGQMRLFVALAAGATVIMTQPHAKELPDLITRERITVLGTVPTSLSDLVDNVGEGCLTSVRTIHVAGDALTADLMAAASRRFPHAEIYAHYSSTEAGYVSVATASQMRANNQTVGAPRSGVTFKVTSGEGYEQPDGTEGEIWVRSGTPGAHTIALEYMDSQSGTLDMGDGWIRTGDLGKTEDGLLWVTGRTKNIVISGGMNISLAEVEQTVSHEFGLPVVCLGVPDARLGERLVCLVEGALPAHVEEMRTRLRRVLPAYKIPRDFRSIDILPRTPTGKIQRRTLQKAWKEE